MPKGKFIRYRAVDIGKPRGHYIKIGIKTKKGPRGGTTEMIGRMLEYVKQ